MLNHIESVHSCPIKTMRLCITSRAEERKCFKMKASLNYVEVVENILYFSIYIEFTVERD